jgi:hypothetical protein
MKYFAALILLLPAITSARDLVPLKSQSLATTLGFLEELTPRPPRVDQPYFVRVFAVPTEVGECGGEVSTCPDVKLYITVSNGDLGETPVLYQLPTSKGWEFVGWTKPTKTGQTSLLGFKLRTTLPESNISPAARKAWRAREYRLLVSTESASYTER